MQGDRHAFQLASNVLLVFMSHVSMHKPKFRNYSAATGGMNILIHILAYTSMNTENVVLRLGFVRRKLLSVFPQL